MRQEESNRHRDTRKADWFFNLFAVALLALGAVGPGQREAGTASSALFFGERTHAGPGFAVQSGLKANSRTGSVLVDANLLHNADFMDPASMPSDAKLLSGTSEQTCLALAIYFEARSEPRKGQQAVGEVILNRVQSKEYPDSVCDVVLQGGGSKRHYCQFTFLCDGLSDRPENRHAWKQANHIARQILYGGVRRYLEDNVLYYHAEYVSPPWARTMLQVEQIGRHLFYALKVGRERGIKAG